MNPLTQTRNQLKMNDRELEMGVSGTKNSWHMEYRDSAWIFLGGLPFEMTEGDVICMFSQYGEVVHINLIRDHGTGKSKGFGFLCYMDQRSTILSVDNLNGTKVLGRMIRVDHVHQYKLPKDLEKLDQDKRKLFEEGCAPKEIDAEVEESSEEEVAVAVEKGKKKKEKKRKKKRSHSTSSETDSSDSEDDRRKKDDKRKDVGKETGWNRNKDKEKEKGTNQKQSLEDRLRAMANYVKQGEGREGDHKRVTAKDMFEKDKSDRTGPSRIKSRSRERRSRSREKNGTNISQERKRRSRSRDRKERSRSRQRKDRSESRNKNRRSISVEKQKRRRSSSRDLSGTRDRNVRRDRSKSRERRRNRKSRSSSNSSS